MTNNKLCFIDLETTGIDKNVHEVIQIGMIFENFDTRKFTSREWKCRPYNYDSLATYDMEALEKNKLTIEKIRSFPDPEETFKSVYETLCKVVDRQNWKDKMFFIGYFSRFDEEFLRMWFDRAGCSEFGKFFWVPSIDVAQIAAFALMNERHKLKNFKLESVCKYLDIKFDSDSAHDAIYDIEKTRELFWRFAGNDMIDGVIGELNGYIENSK